MSWRLVARKDFRNAVGSRMLTGLLGLYVLALVAVVVGHQLVVDLPTTDGLLVALVTVTKWLVPVTALVAGYDAVVGERADGTLTFLLGLPHSRTDVLVGKAIGRIVAVVVPVLVGFGGVAVATFVLYPDLPAGALVTMALAAALLGAAFVAFAVAVSALTASPVRAVAVAVAAFVGTMFLWDLLPTGVYFLFEGSVPGSQVPPDWYFLLERLNPLNAYLALLSSAFETLSTRVPSPHPFYLSGPFSVVVFGLWVLVPLSVGLLRFRSADLS